MIHRIRNRQTACLTCPSDVFCFRASANNGQAQGIQNERLKCNRYFRSQGLRVQLPCKNHAAREEGRARRRGVAAAHRHTRRAEAAGAAASDEGGVKAGKRVHCPWGGALFSASITFAVSQPPTCRRGAATKRERRRRRRLFQRRRRRAGVRLRGLVWSGRRGRAS